MIWNVSHIVWKFKFRSQNFKKRKIFFKNFLISVLFIVIAFSYAGDSDFALSVKGVGVGIEDLQVCCIYYKLNILPAWVVWNWNLHLLSCCFLMFFFHLIPLCGSLCVILCSLIPAVPLVGGVSIFFLNRPISWKLIEIQIFDKKSCF